MFMIAFFRNGSNACSTWLDLLIAAIPNILAESQHHLILLNKAGFGLEFLLRRASRCSIRWRRQTWYVPGALYKPGPDDEFSFIGISHCWESREHPDPFGYQPLERVKIHGIVEMVCISSV